MSAGVLPACRRAACPLPVVVVSHPRTSCHPHRRPVIASAATGGHHAASNGTSSNGSVSSGTTGDTVGVVIVDHGSRKKDSNDMLLEFCELYQRVSGHRIVEPAHMEIAEPTIEQAVARCQERGAHVVVVAPYFLSRGRHIQQDIPALVREAQALHPGLKLIIADPIGVEPLMARIIQDRVQAAHEAHAADMAAAVPTTVGH